MAFLDTSQLDFDQVKQNLKTYLQGQNAFEDYNFEGSNLSVLLDLLSYNTLINGYYLNQVGSEMFLDTAFLRESIVSHAKELNYVPRSRSSSRVRGTISIDTQGATPEIITVPAGYAIQGTLDGVSHDFVLPQQYVIKNNGGVYETETLTFYEGQLVEEIFTSTNQQREDQYYDSVVYPLSSENIDVSSISVVVQESATDLTTKVWTKADSLYGITNSDTVYFIEGYQGNRYQVVFGNDVIGKAIKAGNIVTIQYRDTLGNQTNRIPAVDFGRGGDIDGYSQVTLTIEDQFSYGGSERESKADLKYHAPRHFQTQERAVTSTDYAVSIKTHFPEVQAAIAYGGEQAYPKRYGAVYIAVKPFGTTGIITDTKKDQIVSFLKTKNITTQPIITDPDIFFVRVNSTIRYDGSQTTKTASEIVANVRSAIEALDQTYLGDFDSDLRFSRVVASIDAADQSIISNETEMMLVRRIAPVVNVDTEFNIQFNNILKQEPVSFYQKPGYLSAITSSQFQYTLNDVEYDAYISDDGIGGLYVYTVSPTTGATSIINADIGTVNYDTGEVQFTIAMSNYTSKVDIYARTDKPDLYARQKSFMIIDPADIYITSINDADGSVTGGTSHFSSATSPTTSQTTVNLLNSINVGRQ